MQLFYIAYHTYVNIAQYLANLALFRSLVIRN